MLKLNSDLVAIGIPREYIQFPFSATLPANPTYNGEQIHKLLKFNKEGAHYEYDVPDALFYHPTTPLKGSIIFVELKKVKVQENEYAYFFLSKNISMLENNIESICFGLKKKESGVLFKGVFITVNCISRLMKKNYIKREF